MMRQAERLILTVIATVLAGGLCACGAKKPPPPPLALVPAKLVEPDSLPAPPESLLDEQPASVRAAVEAYRLGRHTPVLHDGITTRFPYDPDAEPVVLCKPLRVTEVLLAPGETVETAGAGDTERWLIQPVSGRVLVKPKEPRIETNLIILTGHHTYHLTLKSGATYMPRVAFYYPKEIIAAEQERRAELERRAR